MITELFQEVDFALGPFAYEATRLEVINFPYALGAYDLGLIMERPKPTSNILSFVEPFSISV